MYSTEKNIMKSLVSAAWVAGVLFAAPAAMAEVDGLGDIVKIDIRDDGRFDVVCKDGSKEVVTFDDLLKDKVCLGGGDNDDDQDDDQDDDEDDTERPQQVEVKDVAINGSGCPNGSDNVTYKLKKKNGSVRAVEIKYNSLEASTDGKRRVFCNAAFTVQHDAAFQYGLDPISVKGVANVADGRKGKHTMDIQFRGTDAKTKFTKTIEGPFNGEYKAKGSETIWSPCGRTLPINIKATLNISGRGDDSSIAMKDYKMVLPLRWKKCS